MLPIPKISKDQRVVGLDIGSTLIKLVEMRGGKDGIQLANLAICPTPPEAISNGVVIEPQTLGTTIREMLAEQRIKTRTVISSVSGQSSLVVRPIEVPKMSRAELADTMKWEVERHIPFVASEVIMDFEPLVEPDQLPEDQTNMEVLLAVAQEDMINAHLETLKVAGLEPICIDVEPLSASRSLVDIDSDQGAYEETFVLVNIGATSADISIINKGLLTMTRPVPVAGNNLTEAIGQALGVDEEEAERLKKEQGKVLLGVAPPIPTTEEAAPTAEEERAASKPSASASDSIVTIPQAPPPPAESTEQGEQEEPKPVFDLSAEPEEKAPPAPEETPSSPEGTPSAEAAPSGPEETPAASEVYDLSKELEKEEAEAAEPKPQPEAESTAAPDQPESPVPEDHALVPEEETTRKIFDAMLPTLSELVVEIRRSVEYYRSRSPDVNISRIILFGGTAKLENLDKFLSNEIGIPAEIAEPLKQISVEDQPYSANYLSEVSCVLPVCVGLAIRDMIG